mgnify:CR=1 FL=1
MTRLFDHYHPQSDRFFDEVIARDGGPRTHYEIMMQRFNQFSAADIRARRELVNIFFRNQGITFTVYGADSSTERIIPSDILPRIIPAAEWSRIEAGLRRYKMEPLDLGA